jgi:hypothetical protein
MSIPVAISWSVASFLLGGLGASSLDAIMPTLSLVAVVL